MQLGKICGKKKIEELPHGMAPVKGHQGPVEVKNQIALAAFLGTA